MTYLIRLRDGLTEYRCTTCRRWYSSLARHVREFHGWDHGPEQGRVFQGYHTATCRCPR